MLDLMGRDVMFDQPDQEGKIEREESYLLSIDRGRSSRDRRLGIQYRTHSTCVKGRTSCLALYIRYPGLKTKMECLNLANEEESLTTISLAAAGGYLDKPLAPELVGLLPLPASDAYAFEAPRYAFAPVYDTT
jgi:hypothetical protein